MNKRLFGTDGIRGVANVYPMTGEIAFRVGRAAAHIFKRSVTNARARVVIGKDTRQSGYMIESALTAGICSMGVDVLLTGPIPTSAVAFLTRDLRCDGGMVISASHNPSEDNGIKIIGADGLKLSDETELEIEELVLESGIDHVRPQGSTIGKAHKVLDGRKLYIDLLKGLFTTPGGLQGMTIAVDCANGAAYRTAPQIFEQLGARVIPIAVEPDGSNINHGTGACHPEHVAAAVISLGADFGLALDGDADRAILCDEKGNILDGDHILAIAGRHYATTGRLEGRKIVTTVMSNIGLDLALKPLNIEVIKTAVGDRYVSEMMRQIDAPLGGEQSGHIIFSRYFPVGDGTLTALRILEIMRETQQPLSQLAEQMQKYPQILLNVPVKERCDLEQVPAIRAILKHADSLLKSEGRVLVRYSGTQPLVRVMVEGKEESTIAGLANEIATVITTAIGPDREDILNNTKETTSANGECRS